MNINFLLIRFLFSIGILAFMRGISSASPILIIVMMMVVMIMILECDFLILKLNHYRFIYHY